MAETKLDYSYLNNDTDIASDKQVEKLVDWKNPPTLKMLKEDFAATQSNTAAQVKKVEDWLDAFNAKGTFAAPKAEGRSQIVVRLVRKQVEWRCPSLTEPFLASRKIFEVAPRTFEDVAAAEQNELILNYQFKTKIKPVKLMDDIVRTMGTEGTVIIHPFWNYKEDVYQEKQDVFDSEMSQDQDYIDQIVQIAEEVKNNPDVLDEFEANVQQSIQKYLETGVVEEFTLVESKKVEIKKVRANHPDAEIVPIEDIFIDPNCKGDIKKAKFIVRRFDTCLATLRSDSRYKQLDDLEKEVEQHAQTPSSNKTASTGFQFKDKARKVLEAYEYWGYYDYHNDGHLYSFVATWVGNTLIRMETNPYPDNGLPFVFIPLLPVKNSVYGEPDAELIKENQQIMSATMRGSIDLFAKSANGQTGFAKGFLDSQNSARFNRGENYVFNPTMHPTNAVHMHKFNEIPQSVFSLMNYLTNEAESFSGVKSFSQGVSGDSLGKTAKGGRNALDATAKRDSSILRRIAEGLVELAYKFQTMNAELLTENDVVRLTNKKFVNVDPNNLNGDFDLSIDISTAEADEAKANDLLMVMQTGQASFPFEFTQQILGKIARLKNLPDLENFIANYQPQPDPLQEKMKELEIAKVQAEIAEINARTAEMNAKALVHQAEIGVRNSRAENVQSQTDSNNIKTYKAANGIEQEEKLQLEDAKQRNQVANKTMQQAFDIEKMNTQHNHNIRAQGAANDLAGNSEA